MLSTMSITSGIGRWVAIYGNFQLPVDITKNLLTKE